MNFSISLRTRSLAFYESLLAALPARTVSDRTGYRRIAAWLIEQVEAGQRGDDIFAIVLSYATEAAAAALRCGPPALLDPDAAASPPAPKAPSPGKNQFPEGFWRFSRYHSFVSRLVTMGDQGQFVSTRPTRMGCRTLLRLILMGTLAIAGGCKKEPQQSASPPKHARSKAATPLHRAAEKGDIEQVRSLIIGGADVNAQTTGDWTPLHYAVREGHGQIVALLLHHGAALNARDTGGNTPLDVAIWSRHPDLAERLIAEGADVKVEDRHGETPLHEAANAGYDDIVKLLITRGADVKAANAWNGTPLNCAASGGHLQVARLLVEAGADVHAKCIGHKTPLHYAVESGHADVAEFLVAKGASLEERNDAGDTPLHVAASRGWEEVAELLVTQGAAIESLTSDDQTALHLAAKEGRSDVVKVLVAHGANVKARDRAGSTPLHLAAASGEGESIECLIAAGANVSARADNGRTPLYAAVLRGHGEGTYVLLSHGADPNAAISSGSTPLHCAARKGLVQLAELLLAHGADVDATTNAGFTPLHSAVRAGHADVAALLIAHGADAAARTSEGRTPIDLAPEMSRQDFVAVLTQDRSGSAAEGPPTASDSHAEMIEAPLPEPKTPLEVLVRGNTAFALDLYRQLQTPERNLFFSPYSISTGLAMAFAAARENTEKQMARTLHFTLDQERLHPAFAELRTMLENIQQAGDIKLSQANSLWPQQGYPFLPAYLSLIERHYGVSITAVDYTSQAARQAACKTINTWVQEKTEGRIADLISEANLDKWTRLVLTNAIYFKGRWESEFDSKRSKDALFFLSARKCVEVAMMDQTKHFKYAETDSVQIVELPYRGAEVSMLVLLPRQIEGLATLEASLSVARLNAWRNALTERRVNVMLPKFAMTFEARLGKTLKAMGMAEALTWPGANFAGFDGDPNWFYIDEVIHKAYVEVNERGTEAAAATAVVMMLGGMPAPPPVFRADHPFLFLIQERQTGSILFIGRATDPTSSGQ
ncbi:MAG: serpin family protein [Sedimentisphaerales bacterium]|jgi:serpin B|nr:serpin family protein [Sedimentisphaerales bacterium]HNY78712.1 serpin family protein [Sedimentisphaerales bacterium]HOC63907.1 serpin family protein [Sedimentisphaerales bacterium]HOH64675.1 serpin family protein [Sedimentisphaerales bacterium]HPY49254.1 serpin family protein [Sedimentisphaerales bacterium]